MSNPLGEITRSSSIRDGLDDGPELPSQDARDRAAAKIEAQRLITDAERVNWLEKTKYIEIGIGYHDHHPAMQIRFLDHGNLKVFSGRSLRAAIDEAVRAEDKPKAPQPG